MHEYAYMCLISLFNPRILLKPERIRFLACRFIEVVSSEFPLPQFHRSVQLRWIVALPVQFYNLVKQVLTTRKIPLLNFQMEHVVKSSADTAFISKEIATELFSKVLTSSESIPRLSKVSFQCAQAMFLYMNTDSIAFKANDNFVVESLDLLHVDGLWQILLETPSAAVVSVTVAFINALSAEANLSEKLKLDSEGVQKRFVDKCMQQLQVQSLSLPVLFSYNCLSSRIAASLLV